MTLAEIRSLTPTERHVWCETLDEIDARDRFFAICDRRAAAEPRKAVWQYEKNLILRGFRSDPESRGTLLSALANSA